jgi:hypothetical protein
MMTQDTQAFQLATARSRIEPALEQADFDLVNDPAEPNLIQAQRDRAGDSTVVVIDSGGQMRFTRTRRIAPEKAQTRRTASRRLFQITHQENETVTISYQLQPAEFENFAALLAEMDKV